MKKSIVSIIALLIFHLTSCNFAPKGDKLNLKPEDYRTVGDTLNFTMKIPEFMEITNTLNSDAALQCLNSEREIYTFVNKDNKAFLIETFKITNQYDESLNAAENYYEMQLGLLEQVINIKERSQKKSLKINGLNAVQSELLGTLNDPKNEIRYLMTYIEGTEDVYFILSWTSEYRFDTYRKMFQTMATSFQIK